MSERVQIFTDRLLRSTCVVQTGANTRWLVPRRQDGWKLRQRVTMAAAKRVDRLRPDNEVDPEWLGIPAGTGCDR